jgi:hypothetical protein
MVNNFNIYYYCWFQTSRIALVSIKEFQVQTADSIGAYHYYHVPTIIPSPIIPSLPGI